MSDLPKPAVAIVDADAQQCGKSCVMLEQLDYPATPLYSRLDLEAYLKRQPDGIVILDMDTVPADNRFFRELKRQAPGLTSWPCPAVLITRDWRRRWAPIFMPAWPSRWTRRSSVTG